MRAFFPATALLALAAALAGCLAPPQPSDAPLVLEPASPGERAVVRMSAYRYDFAPNLVRVREGQEVVLQVSSVDVAGRFALKAFNVSLDLAPGRVETARFVARQRGEFVLRCVAGCPGQAAGMQARFRVS